jgi:hypothetical protein
VFFPSVNERFSGCIVKMEILMSDSGTIRSNLNVDGTIELLPDAGFFGLWNRGH